MTEKKRPVAQFDSEMGVELITPVESLLHESYIADAARCSLPETRRSLPDVVRDDRLIRRLWLDGHGTPFEYPNIIFQMDIPIFVHNQLVKHRISTINTQSGRYSEFAPRFYIPSSTRPTSQSGKAIDYELRAPRDTSELLAARNLVTNLELQCAAWYESYIEALEGGVAREVARMGMPLNTYTKCWVNMNLRSWLNFISLRLYDPERGFNSHGQYEISEIAQKVLDVLTEFYPATIEAFMEQHAEKAKEN